MPADQPKHPSAWYFFTEDRKRYKSDGWMNGRLWWTTDLTIIAVFVLRLGHYIEEVSPAVLRVFLRRLYLPIYLLSQIITSIEIPATVRVGPRLRIYHGRNIVINDSVVIGTDCVLRQGVTIGNLKPYGAVPTVGNFVEFGAYAQVFGDVTIGDGAKIGAHAVVLTDVPPGATAVGIPARIIPASK